jgi:hypothetical protein
MTLFDGHTDEDGAWMTRSLDPRRERRAPSGFLERRSLLQLKSVAMKFRCFGHESLGGVWVAQ